MVFQSLNTLCYLQIFYAEFQIKAKVIKSSLVDCLNQKPYLVQLILDYNNLNQ